uniref:Uncharacterized protein n=1 Tax=viral metagenome TaxID=1070528 RepID=A0A6C0M3F5_9ZZZZ
MANALGQPVAPPATRDRVEHAIQINQPAETIMGQFRTLTPLDRTLAAETAVAWDRYELVQLILAEYPEIANSTDLNYDDTLLITAIIEENPGMAVYLVSKTSPQTLLHVVPIHPEDPVAVDGATALHLAVAGNMADVVRAIVEKNENTVFVPNVPNGVTPIDLARRTRNAEILAILLEPTREKGRGARNAGLLGNRQQLPHAVEGEIASYLTGVNGYIHQQRDTLRRRFGFQEPPQQRRDIGGRKRKTRKNRRVTSSRRRRTLSRARLASS